MSDPKPFPFYRLDKPLPSWIWQLVASEAVGEPKIYRFKVEADVKTGRRVILSAFSEVAEQ